MHYLIVDRLAHVYTFIKWISMIAYAIHQFHNTHTEHTREHLYSDL